MGWGSGPENMEEDAELEEGEACYYKDDDYRSIDPDIALSYIDEKLQSVLGHFQKDFEGGVSAENLGAKFGGYGSFLPTYQRSPSIWSQPQSPQRIQAYSITRSPNHSRTEGAAQNTSVIPDAPVSQRNGSAAPCSVQPLHETKVSSADASVRKDSCLSSTQVAEKLPGRHQPSSIKSLSSNDQRKLKFRIKVGSDKTVPRNAAIYSGLGLTSPSSSMENSPGDSGGIPFDSQEVPDKSPACILQMLTSFTVAGDLLLSPLHDNIFKLLRKFSMESKPEKILKVKHNHSGISSDDTFFMLGDGDILTGKQTKGVGKSETLKESRPMNRVVSPDEFDFRLKKNSGADLTQNRQYVSFDVTQKHVSDSLGNTGESPSDSSRALETVIEPENGFPMKKRELSKDKMKGKLLGTDFVKDESFASVSGPGGLESEHQEAKCSSVEKIGKNPTKGSQDIPLDRLEGVRSKVNRISASLKADSDFSKADRESKGAADHLIQKAGMKATSREKDELRMPDSTKKLFESKKKMKGNQVNGQLSSDVAQEIRRVGAYAAAKEKKGTKKDVYKARKLYKDMFDTNPKPSGLPVNLLEKVSGERSKDSKFDITKEKHAYADRSKEKSSHIKLDNQLVSEALVKDPLTDSIPPTNGLAQETEQATAAPVLIEEHWVGCDHCGKWRLLPHGAEELPEKWLCSMLNWLPGMNRCDISEDETTAAVRALCQLPLPENQNSAQHQAERNAPGVNPADVYHFKQNHQNVSSEYMDIRRKKKHKSKETSNTVSKAGLNLPLNTAKNFQQDTVKSGILNDVKKPFAGVDPISKVTAQHLSKLEDSVVEKCSNIWKKDHVTGGDSKPKRKISRETDPGGHGIAKKIKTDGAFDKINSQASGGNLHTMGLSSNAILPTMSSLKDKERNRESGYSKDEKLEGNESQTSAKKQREGLVDILGSDSLDVRNSNDSQVYAKKRKLKNWQSSQTNIETLQSDGSHLYDKKVPMKEESIDSGLRRNRKPRVSQTEGKDLSRSKGNDERKREGMMTKMFASGNRENTIGRGFDKEKLVKRYRIKVTSQLTMEDLESLKKDLGSEQVSTTATSSSSKVSGSRKTRGKYQELRGSPVESVSSSPMRMSNLNTQSPMGMDCSVPDDVEVGDHPLTGSPKKFVNGDIKYETKRFGMAKKKASNIFHPESFNNPVLDFRETDGREKFGDEGEAGHKPSLLENGHLDDNHLDNLEGNNQCPTDMHASKPCFNKNKINKNHYNAKQPEQKSLMTPLLSKDKARPSGFNSGGALEKVSDSPNNQGISNPKKPLRLETEIDRGLVATCGDVSGDVKQPFSGQPSLKFAKSNKNVVNRDSRKGVDDRRENQLKFGEHGRLGDPCKDIRSVSMQQGLNEDFKNETLEHVTTQVDYRDGKLQVDRSPEGKHDVRPANKLGPGSLLRARPRVIPTNDDASRESKILGSAFHQIESRQGVGHSTPDCSVVWDLTGPVLVRKDALGQTTSVALKEAEDLKDCADRLKKSGFGYESNEAYFQAALKFLHGASLLESNSGSSKHGEMNQLQIYINTAKLCETSAREYERRQQMAVAALAYKCMEVAYMRVVYCKNSSTNRLWHDLLASLQMVPQGESPSSSASDIDNLNNQALVDKASLSKSNGSDAGNHVIAPRSRPNFVRLLDFTKDVNSAMEASRKSQIAFAAANVILEEAQNKEGIVSVKRAIDFSFQDVEELVRLVRLAIEAISRQGFSGSRD